MRDPHEPRQSTYEFEAYGTTFEAMEADARKKADAYWGEHRYELKRIDAIAIIMRVDGQVGLIKGQAETHYVRPDPPDPYKRGR